MSPPMTMMIRSSLRSFHSVRSGRSASALAILFAIAGASLTTACGMDSVVGGTCKAGYVQAGGSCVLGANTNSPNFTPKQTTDAPLGSSTDPTDPNTTPATTTTSTPSSAPLHPVIPTHQWDPQHFDDDAGAIVPPPTPALVCDGALVACHGVCIAVDFDARNCGACGRICPSNICVAGECQGATPGDVVLIGHEMKSAWTGSVQAKVLTNAVSIPTTDPIRVLSFQIGGDADNAAHAHALIHAGITDRNVQITSASAEALDSTNLYATYDVVLMEGVGNDPAGLGARWSAPLQTFTKKGGVFVALDDGAADMPSLVNAAGLLTVGPHVAIDASMHFVVSGASDVVGRQLLSPFASFGPSVGFTGVEPQSADVTYVIHTQDDAAIPTVIHKIAR